jgi:long-chain acyl-CoA synthetase
MSFLPLSHIYERSLHSTLLLAGIKIHFAESLEKLVENLAEVKPDVMIGVPRVFEKMYLKIQEKLRSAPTTKKVMANLAFQIGRATVPYRVKDQSIPWPLAFLNGLAESLVLNKIRSITGGELKFFISGGAPLSKEIAEFFFQTGITILEGYGLSETLILSVNLPGDIRFGTVGKAFSETEIKIAEDGEILVKGPQVMKGYYKRPDFTKEVMTEDGWFKTGDIGEFDSAGSLKITDRKKELIVTAGGKKVAPQMLENHLKAHPLVEQVCVIGDRRKYITALVVPNLEIARSWAADSGEKLQSLDDCMASPLIQRRIQSLIDEMNEESGRFESIKYFRLLPQAFSIEGGELTPTMKLKRRVIQEKYKSLIDSMYPAEEQVA